MRRTAAARAFGIAAVVLLAAGLILARPDLAVLGTPFAIAAALALRRTAPPARVEVAVAPGGGALTATARLDAGGEGLVVLRASAYGERATAVVVPARRAPLVAPLPVLHSGPQHVLRVHGIAVTADAAVVVPFGPVDAAAVLAPTPVPLRGSPPPFEPSPRPGVRPARRTGDGLDFRDLAPFVPGDRLRRIDWRATARSGREGELVVRRTDALAEATVLVMLDPRDDAGAVLVEWTTARPARTGPTSLDLGRQAALSLARAAAAAGDRVGFVDLARPERGVRPGGGRRQLERLRATIAATGVAPGRSLRALPAPPGALLLVCSTFLDDEAGGYAVVQRSVGHRVIAVDTLPPVDTTDADRLERDAFRIVDLERRDRLAALRAADVPVVPWSAPDLAVRLEALRRPRVRR